MLLAKFLCWFLGEWFFLRANPDCDLCTYFSTIDVALTGLFLLIFLESKSTLLREMIVLAISAELLSAGKFLSIIFPPESGFILSNRSIIKNYKLQIKTYPPSKIKKRKDCFNNVTIFFDFISYLYLSFIIVKFYQHMWNTYRIASHFTRTVTRSYNKSFASPCIITNMSKPPLMISAIDNHQRHNLSNFM